MQPFLNLKSNFDAVHGGKIKVKVGNYPLAKLVAGYASELKPTLKPKNEDETILFDNLLKFFNKESSFYNTESILENNVDTISFIPNNSFRINPKIDITFVYNDSGISIRFDMRFAENTGLNLTISCSKLEQEIEIDTILSKNIAPRQNIFDFVYKYSKRVKSGINTFLKLKNVQNFIEKYRKKSITG